MTTRVVTAWVVFVCLSSFSGKAEVPIPEFLDIPKSQTKADKQLPKRLAEMVCDVYKDAGGIHTSVSFNHILVSQREGLRRYLTLVRKKHMAFYKSFARFFTAKCKDYVQMRNFRTMGAETFRKFLI